MQGRELITLPFSLIFTFNFARINTNQINSVTFKSLCFALNALFNSIADLRQHWSFYGANLQKRIQTYKHFGKKVT